MKKNLLILIGLSMILLGDFSRSSGVVIDSVSRLEWQDDGTYDGGYRDRKWEFDIDYCENLELDGGGWRLPNINELISIVDDTQYRPAISPVFQYLSFMEYWSSTSYSLGGMAAWGISFSSGSIFYRDKDEDYCVMCVRGGQ